MKRNLIIAILAAISTGCAGPKYTAKPLETTPEVITIVEDSATRSGFLRSVTGYMDDHGIDYRVVPDNHKMNPDEATLKYVGHWSWDLALFLREAHINVYEGGEAAGTVTFKVPYMTANPAKFGNAERRIRTMLDVLTGKQTATEATHKESSSD